MRCIAVAAAALLLVGCKATVVRPDANAASQSVDQLAAAVAEDSRRSETETDAKNREQLAADANRDAQACLNQAPGAAACLYYHAIALGLDARAHPLHASDDLKAMIEGLGRAQAADAQFDQAGPSRVRALVFLRAPAWPLGPGDPDAAVASAREAVTLKPQYPANQLALAEALAKTGDQQAAAQSYARARDLARAMPPSSDREDWLRQADQALAKLPKVVP